MRRNRRIIFLDIDGVLNSHIIAEEWFRLTGKVGYGGWFNEEDIVIEKSDVKWGHLNVSNLREIVEATDAKIVISSDWRRSFSVEKFKQMFELYGWKAPVIDKTTVLKSRGLEIAAWLAANSDVENYVIIDDNDQFLPDQLDRFVHTNPECGLSWNDTQKAILILNQ